MKISCKLLHINRIRRDCETGFAIGLMADSGRMGATPSRVPPVPKMALDQEVKRNGAMGTQ